MVSSRQAKYFLQDHLGSTTALTDSSSNVTSSASYDSFGNSTNNLSTRYQYTGREKDEFTGLHYYRARWYDANLGRFISEDPIGFAGGDVNLFGYVNNNPVKYTDPSGLQTGSGIEFLPPGYYGDKWYQKIEDDFNNMKNSCECRTSFEGFGIDLDNLSRQGLIVGSGDTLAETKYQSSRFRLTDDERNEGMKHRGARAFTFLPGVSQYDARPHIFLNPNAARNGWGGYGDPCALREAFAHELMHAGNIEGRPRNLILELAGYDDLTYLNGYFDRPYSRLISNCGCK